MLTIEGGDILGGIKNLKKLYELGVGHILHGIIQMKFPLAFVIQTIPIVVSPHLAKKLYKL